LDENYKTTNFDTRGLIKATSKNSKKEGKKNHRVLLIIQLTPRCH
jgi:hypothetical protein